MPDRLESFTEGKIVRLGFYLRCPGLMWIAAFLGSIEWEIDLGFNCVHFPHFIDWPGFADFEGEPAAAAVDVIDVAVDTEICRKTVH